VQFTASPTVKCVQSIRRVFTVCASNVFTVAADLEVVAARRHPVTLLRIRDDNDDDNDDEGEDGDIKLKMKTEAKGEDEEIRST